MNLGIEYLIRSGVAKDLLEFPCSLFIEKQRNEKVVVIIAKSRQTYSIKHWNLFLCEPGNALPPMHELEVEKIQDFALNSEFSPLRYFGQPIPSKRNSWRHPMPKHIYEEYYNKFMSSMTHELIKRCWLWAAFMDAYQISTSLRLEFLPEYLKMLQEQEWVMERCPRKWKFWGMWCKHMLAETNNDMATELAFSTV